MKFKPTTYLASFAGFVILFMGLGGYVGYGKIAEHLLVIAYLDALPVNAQRYLTRITELTGVPLCMVTVGSERDETIVFKDTVMA